MGDGSHSPSLFAVVFALTLLGLAVLIAWALPDSSIAFTPSNGFVALAGFYIAAQVIERGLEFIQPVLGWLWPRGPVVQTAGGTVPALSETGWFLPIGEGRTSPALNGRQIDLYTTNRTLVTHGLAVLAAAPLCAVFGLYFLESTGYKGLDHHWDTVLSAILISGGTKPLHDFISYIEKAATK